MSKFVLPKGVGGGWWCGSSETGREEERNWKGLAWIKINKKESRRDQEDGGELDSQEEASPEEVKSMEVVLG